MTPRRGSLYVAAVLIAAIGAGPTPATRAADFKSGVEAFDAGDVESAWFEFWMLSQDGDPAAQYNLAQFYRQGIGIEVDLREARRWYERAASQGHGLAQYALGLMFETGDGGRRDLSQARTWYARAADQRVEAAIDALDRLARQTASPR
ncbi:MAG TPA: tetratricopeptide repeat protein [Alphaproteobacteria bacterium]|nr:tetratricopeptide repeat protein [Alphaproteobacteria bacterium]